MMPRRDESILNFLVEVPWWASVCLSAGVFVLLRFVVPLFAPAEPASTPTSAIKRLLGAHSMAAWYVSLVLLIPAPIAAFHDWRKRRLLDNQTDLASIRSLSWQQFETLVAEAYRREGYAVVHGGGNGPGGVVDLVLKKHGNALLVQGKQWTERTVGVNVVLEVFGVMTDRQAQGAIILTLGRFTQDARTFARGKPLDLVEGQKLAELIRTVKKSPVPRLHLWSRGS
jgi:restriction system protein